MQDHRDRLPPAGRPPRMGRLRAAIGHDLGVDLGTANTLIFLRGRGVVLAQPSFVAIDTNEGALIGAGEEAREMLGRTPSHIEVIRPLQSGVISRRKQRAVLIGERTAEKVKQQAASAWPGVRDVNADIVGRDLTTGRPKRIRLTAEELREGIAEPVDDISDAVVSVFDKLPPE